MEAGCAALAGPQSWSLLAAEGTWSLLTGFLEISFATVSPCACPPTPSCFGYSIMFYPAVVCGVHAQLAK